MPQYSCTVNATSNTSINTEDSFLELSVNQPKIKKVRVRLGDGTATAGVDNDWRVRLARKTVAGSGGVAGTNVNWKILDRTSGATTTIKTGTTAFSVGTVQGTLDTVVKNGRETYEYIAVDKEDYIEVHPTLGSGGMFSVLIQSGVASQKFNVTVWWEE